MSAEQNKDLVRGWWDALNQGNAVDVVEEFYAADYVLHDPTQPEPVRGVEGVRAFISGIASGFPDMQCTIEDLLADGDKVVQRLTVRGTQQGEFQGMPPSGKAVEIWLMVISRIANNKIAEEWQLVDSFTLLQQLGAVPAPGEGSM
jgi:steroid delta-isomerase-like uncharacterized protein